MNNQPYKKKVWDNFLKRHKVVEHSTELFTHEDGICSTTFKGRMTSKRPFLIRNPSMENLIIDQAALLESSFHSRSANYDGLIYLMFSFEKGEVVPLYIGKTETLGKNENLSENIRNLKANKGKFARWGDGYQYHIGDLSAVVLKGHSADKKSTKYTSWADALFLDYPTDNPKLRRPIRFWCKAWQSCDVGVWEDFGSTSLTFLEYQMIGVASSLYPDDLLNREGKNR